MCSDVRWRKKGPKKLSKSQSVHKYTRTIWLGNHQSLELLNHYGLIIGVTSRVGITVIITMTMTEKNSILNKINVKFLEHIGMEDVVLYCRMVTY